MNKTLLIGRLVKDPELKQISEDKVFTRFVIAINRYNANKDNSVDYIPIVAWGKTAEFVGKYIKKGTLISVIGRIRTGNYETKEGDKKYYMEIIANEVQLLSSVKKEEIKEA